MEGDGFVKQAVRVFRLIKPFNDYLNAELEGFKMPAR